MTGGAVVPWTDSDEMPSWEPVEGAIGIIDQTEGDDDGDLGGLADVWVPAAPDETWAITVYLTNANELQEAYGFLQLNTTVIAASSTAGSFLMDATAMANSAVTGGASQILTPEKGFVTFYVSNADGTLSSAASASLTAAATGTSTNPDHANVFTVGIDSGSVFVSEGSNQDNLDPDFTIEVSQLALDLN